MSYVFDEIDDLLYQVESPERYIGREWNSRPKDWKSFEYRVCMAFPDVYEIGMSHLGLSILYHLLNSQEDILCERVFAPWKDMEELLRSQDINLFSLENKRELIDFDVLGFTLQYELSYTTILNMLDLGGLPVKSEERDNKFPLVIGGGSTVFNPEPLTDFFDLFFIGEAETGIIDLVKNYRNMKAEGKTREKILRQLAKQPGVYVPSLYQDHFQGNQFTRISPVSSEIKNKVEKQYVQNLDEAFYPSEPIVPYMDIVHNRASLEISRGCQRGCRFCAAGMSYRPARERSKENIINQAEEIIDSTGYEELSLASLNTVDHSQIEEILNDLNDKFANKNVSLSLPSLRVNNFSVNLARQVQKVRRSGLTFAPEAGTQRLRDVINKGVQEEDYLEAVKAAFANGWHRIKLYFMIGLPGETEEDLDGLVELVKKTANIGREIRKDKKENMRPIEVQVNVTTFVPKPFTPFQWVDMDSKTEIEEKIQFLQKNLRGKGISFDWNDPELSRLEGVLARGDRRLNDVIFQVWKQGGRLEGWSEEINFDLWEDAFGEHEIEPGYFLSEYEVEDNLPWEHLMPGVDRGFLKKELQASHRKDITPDCRWSECSFCGVCGKAHANINLADSDRGFANDD